MAKISMGEGAKSTSLFILGDNNAVKVEYFAVSKTREGRE